MNNNDLDGHYRIGIYLRRQGETISSSEELKTEEYDDLADLDQAVTNFIQGELANLEEELRDEDED